MVESIPKAQHLELTWKQHAFQALIVPKAKGHAAKALRKLHLLQALVELMPKRQGFLVTLQSVRTKNLRHLGSLYLFVSMFSDDFWDIGSD